MTAPFDLERRLIEILTAAGVESPEADVRWIIEAATGLDRGALAMMRSRLDDAAVVEAVAMAERRAAGEPLQYVTGSAGFRNLEIQVGPGVLVPRPETELVAGCAIHRLPPEGIAVDVGCGSGAIALAIKDEVPAARVLATDVSSEALAWARRNAAALELDVEILQGDLMAPIPGKLRGRIDVIVANPPYVAETEAGILPTEVVDHEPHVALFAGPDGTSVIERLILEAEEWLGPSGWLVLEIGETQGRRIASRLEELSFRDVAVLADHASRDRIVEARRP